MSIKGQIQPHTSLSASLLQALNRFIFGLLDVAIWLLTLGPWINLKGTLRGRFFGGSVESVQVGDTNVREGTKRHVIDGETTLYDMLQNSCQKHASFKAQRTGASVWRTYRELGATAARFGAGLRALGMTPLSLEASQRVVTTVAQDGERAAAAAQPLDGQAHTVLLLGAPHPDWFAAALGCWGQSLVVATAHPALAKDSLAEVLALTRPRAVLCGGGADAAAAAAAVAALVGEAHGRGRALKDTVVVVLGGPSAGQSALDAASLAGGWNGPRVMTFAQVASTGEKAAVETAAQAAAQAAAERERGAPRGPAPASRGPCPPLLALVMFTMGTTGKPKGAMLTHGAVAAAVQALAAYLEQVTAPPTPAFQERYTARHSSAKSFFFAFEAAALVLGAALQYAQDADGRHGGAGDRRDAGGGGAGGDEGDLSDTLFVGVPRDFDRLLAQTEAEIATWSVWRRSLHAAATAERRAALRQGRGSAASDFVLRRLAAHAGSAGSAGSAKAQAKAQACLPLGPTLKLAVSCGGTLAGRTQDLVRGTHPGANVVQAYGLTETCGVAAAQGPRLLDMSSGAATDSLGASGPPLAGVQVELASVLGAEGEPLCLDRQGAPYLATDRTHLGTPCLGRGEVRVRGDMVMAGYYQDGAGSRQALDEDGWLHTGDVGVWRLDGSLALVDRVKNLVKLRGGEYVAVEVMEDAFNQSAFVNGRNGGTYVHADGSMDQAVAVVQVSEYDLKRWADERGLYYTSFEALCTNPTARRMVADDLNAVGQGRFRGGGGEGGEDRDPGRALVHAPWAVFAYLSTRAPLLEPSERVAPEAVLVPGHRVQGSGGVVGGGGGGGPSSPVEAGVKDTKVAWTMENGLITASGALNRKKLHGIFEGELAATVAKVRS